jgi:ketosteroid isomerase-like protein
MSEALKQQVKQQITQLEERRWTAMTQNDFATLNELLADDLVYTHSSAVVDDKASYIESLRSGAVKYKKAEREPCTVTVHGDTAIVTGSARVSVFVRGQDKLIHMRYSNVWIKQAGGWKFALWHSTSIPASA